MFISNFKELAETKARKDALEIMEAGISASMPEAVLEKKLRLNGSVLKADGKRLDLSKYKNIYVVGGGKAAFRAAKFTEKTLGGRITDGVVLDVKAGRLKKIRCYEGTHPFPTEKNVAATKELVALLKKAKKGDLVITIVSGGGSSLLCDPHKTTCAEIKNITEEFFRRGADIKEINIVRKHISNIHGGNIARLAYPADVLGLVFSDIPFNDPSFVASGPTYMDKTTAADARKIALKYGIKGMSFLETTKDKKYFGNVANVLMLSSADALSAMKAFAEKKGYSARICGSCLKGEAKELIPRLLKNFEMPSGKSVLLGGGETTVKITKKGKGGRNLETAMGALGVLSKNAVVISMASDGKDHIDGVGGGIADSLVAKKARDLGYDYKKFLEDNMSYKFMRDTNGLIRAKKTGTNVSDLIIILKAS